MKPTALVTFIALLLATPALVLPAVSAGELSSFEEEVPSFDNHEVPVKVYLATGDGPAPTLLWGHGWAGSYGSSTGDGEFFASNGYNVVAMDFRGFGKARETTQARVHSVDFEIKDVMAVIDWIADQSWAELDAPDDPVLGALGGSYGGGYQLLTAALDDRLDAIAPEITWHDLTQSLQPSGNAAYGTAFHERGAVKSAWVQLLYHGGNAAGNLHPMIHEAYASAMALNEVSDESPLGAALVESLRASSPKSYDGAIDIPTFLIQGMPDTLFNYNEAFANKQMIEATGASVKLATHLGGHIISTEGTVPIPSPFPVGLQPGAREGPCASDNDAILAWYDKHLKGLPADTGPEMEMALDDGTCITSDTHPGLLSPTPLVVEGRDTVLVHPTVVPETGRATLGDHAVDWSVSVARHEAGESLLVAGVPHLTGTIHVEGPEAIAFFALTVWDGITEPRVLSSQYTPLRAGPGATPFALDLGGVATQLAPGEEIVLEVYTWNEQYATNHGRLPGAYALEDVTLTLPTVPVPAAP